MQNKKAWSSSLQKITICLSLTKKTTENKTQENAAPPDGNLSVVETKPELKKGKCQMLTENDL